MKNLIRAFVGLVILSGLIAGTAGSIYHFPESDSAQFELNDVEVIVCLAGARGRLASCGNTWMASGEKSTLYLSGVGHKTNWSVLEAQLTPEVMRVIRPENVIFENESGNTIQNARYFKTEQSKRGWKKILLMTSSYHMKRSEYLFRTILSDVPGIQLRTEPIWSDPFNSESWYRDLQGVQVTVAEYLKYWAALVMGPMIRSSII